MRFPLPSQPDFRYSSRRAVKHLMPSENWQIAFSIVGAVAVGISAGVVRPQSRADLHHRRHEDRPAAGVVAPRGHTSVALERSARIDAQP
ncbi:hypothetical protein NKY68_24275 [Sinorhizobium meliloti]|uniref:hypothetical protein n=1 Tax=Rhizobium meliloti TaxID=382 RepID=UPI003D64F370